MAFPGQRRFFVRAALVVLGLIALNVGGLLLSAIEPSRGIPGLDLVAVVATTQGAATTTVPQTPGPAQAAGQGQPQPGPGGPGGPGGQGGRPQVSGVRSIVFSPDGRTGWEFPRRPPDASRGRGGPPPQQEEVVVRPLGVSRPGLDGTTMYLASLAATIGAGAALIFLFPRRMATIGGVITRAPLRWLRLGAIGVVAYAGAAALTLLMVIVVTGIPLAVAMVMALSVATLLGLSAISLALGGRLLGWMRAPSRHPLLAFSLGTFLLVPLTVVPVVGWGVTIAAAVVGFGAVMLTRLGSEIDADLSRSTAIPA